MAERISWGHPVTRWKTINRSAELGGPRLLGDEKEGFLEFVHLVVKVEQYRQQRGFVYSLHMFNSPESSGFKPFPSKMVISDACQP